MNMTDKEILAVAEATGLKLITLGLDKQKSEFLILAFAKQIAKLERYHEREACAKALDALENLKHKIRYENEQDEIGSSICCDELSFKPHSEDCKLINAITAINKALAQPPLTENGIYQLGYHNGYGFGEAYGKANPPERTWVGLTDDEIEVLFQTAAGADEEVHIRFARAIESKLKEVNT